MGLHTWDAVEEHLDELINLMAEKHGIVLKFPYFATAAGNDQMLHDFMVAWKGISQNI